MAVLYVVATPIGNLEDISPRGLRILQEVGLIAAEDTRHTRKLLQRYQIETRLIAYHEHNKLARLDTILLALANGEDVALVSDAGTPAISDPGYELVGAVIGAGFAVVPIPGPSAVITGLSASGLPTDRFYYLGFPPRRSKERIALFSEVVDIPATLVLYEAPHRISDSLADALSVLGDRPAAVARELTKLHEQFVRGTLSDLVAHFNTTEPRGEFVLMIGGATRPAKRKPTSTVTNEFGVSVASTETPAEVDWDLIRAELQRLRAEGWTGTKAAKQLAKQYELDRHQVYSEWSNLPE
ncbi:16S rRNA (cytidine(1402)-2'-O)-methyltransferase [Herpetosiphon giganteus]|uniref:16S rRNA (cytidine(1402)-2'-O)-methyltransferase n=1 Tax=Herpetosiphon giganteus TaxID=2029754 RepID=UPI00195C02AE|nr:16S rRNA (cytidine(1402)-2'-O)-methyltransferase [Herpetosiphon giganteus]MBM7845090.1 16S rRNA (cytidine1402-2'-O)-methyltransferase [Herpetosiphon giganteus]